MKKSLSAMYRRRILKIWVMAFALLLSVSACGRTAEAAVKNEVKSVDIRIGNQKVTKKTYTLEAGQSKNLKVSASPAAAVKSIRYKSNSPKIVSVDKNGKMTSKKKGTAKLEVTVTGKNNKKKTAWVKIKVTNPVIKFLSVTIDGKGAGGKTYSLEKGKSVQLKVSATPEKAMKSVTYQSADTKVVKVSKKGVVTAKGKGTAKVTITAVNQDRKKKTAWVNFKVKENKPEPTPTPEPTPEPTPDPAASKILIAYFSATNTTKKIAEYLAEELNADLYEIVPAVPYTSSDLDYNDSSSRSSKEQNDPKARPEISGSVEKPEQYEIVFLGYPIWWGEAPRIISTFLESYDFSGKTIIPFCTSASSGIGSSATDLHSLTEGAEWLKGKRFGKNASKTDIKTWIEELGIMAEQKEKKKINITVGDTVFTAELADNSSAEAFAEKLAEKSVTIKMQDYGNFEKVGPLGFDLPRNDEQITTEPGDIILYQGNQITIYYDTNSWKFTRLGKIQDVTAEELKKALGKGDVTVTFSLSDSEGDR